VVILSTFMMVATVVLAGACGSQPGGTPKVGKMRHASKSVEPENAQSARAQLEMDAGELNLTGGADKLMEADFSYNVPDWKPKVSYDVSGKKGEILVTQGSANGDNLSGGARNEWDIGLNDEVPTDLVVRLGAGGSDLDLDSLTLTGLDLRMGAGKTIVDLSGDYARDFDASIVSGVGGATLLLPSEVGVKAKAEGGLGGIDAEGLKKVGGAYINDAYGESDVNLSIDVKGGVGKINLKVV
jgi:hypothetical protein